MPDTSTAVSMFCFSKMLRAVLVSGQSVDNVFLLPMPAYLKRLAGLWQLCFCLTMGSEGNNWRNLEKCFLSNRSRLAASGAHWFA